MSATQRAIFPDTAEESLKEEWAAVERFSEIAESSINLALVCA